MICKAFQVNFSLKNINNRYNQGWNIATIYPTVGIMNTGIAHILSYFPLPQTFVKELGKLAYLVQISNYSFTVFSMEQKTSSSKSQSKSFRAKLWIYVIRKNKSTVMSIWNENGSIILTNINVSIQFCVRSPSWWQSVWRWRSQQQASSQSAGNIIFDIWWWQFEYWTRHLSLRFIDFSVLLPRTYYLFSTCLNLKDISFRESVCADKRDWMNLYNYLCPWQSFH